MGTKFVCAGCGKQEDKASASFGWLREPRKYDDVELCSADCLNSWREEVRYIMQLHWQDRDDCNDTEFVAQTSIKDEGPEAIAVWFNSLAKDGLKCPDGKVPVLMESGCHNFVWAKAK